MVAKRVGNVLVAPFPQLSWEPDLAAASLADLYRWACSHALAAIQWYLDKKASNARASRSLRLAAILLVTAGGALPVLVTTFDQDTALFGLGYLLLGAAAGCVAVDRFFGISTAWMRYLTTEVTLQRELQRFQVAWARLSVRCAPVPSATEIDEHLALLGAFVDRVSEEMAAETKAWVEEFRGSLAELNQTATPRPAVPS